MKDTSATERVGRYQLLEPIGIGCCGAVARAKVFGVAGFERQFAVKKFHTELTASAAQAQALSSAARAYGSLEHPRIARMSEFGVAQGATFTAVEFVAGLDALRLLAEAKLAGVTLAAGGSLTLISQAARAVGYAHGRGLTHLGLAPTNVIVTADGDVKITDFGILAATLPARPTDVARLANRIGYLAPEQLAGEATSAATDVFALGVIAYELVTGQRAFRGETPAQIAQAILTSPPPEPQLPRPIVRVLQRCLARSPFERFPDARALADALDAALRVAPVPGTRKDIGAQVKDTIDRLAAINESGLSGVVALNVGTGPVRRVDPAPDVRSLGSEAGMALHSLDAATSEFVRPDTPVDAPSPLARIGDLGASSTVPDMIRAPLATMPGLAPPPIPVPQGVAPPPIPRPNSNAIPPTTLLGIPSAPKPQPKGGIPPIKPVVPPVIPPVGAASPPPIPPAMPRASTREVNALPRRQSQPGSFIADADLDQQSVAPVGAAGRLASSPGIEIEPYTGPDPVKSVTEVGPDQVDPTSPGLAVAPRRNPSTTAEMSSEASEQLVVGSTRPTEEIQPLVAAVVAQELARQSGGLPAPLPPPPATVPHQVGQPLPTAPQESGLAPAGNPSATMLGVSPPIRPSQPRVPSLVPSPVTESSTNPPESVVATTSAPPAKRSSVPWIAGIVVGLGALAFIGWQIMDVMSDDGMPVATPTVKRPVVADPDRAIDGGVVALAADASTGTARSDAAVAVAASDAAGRALDASVAAIVVDASAGVDAVNVAAVPVDAPAVTSASGSKDTLVIDSTPKGARVFLGGSDQGVTPLKLAGSTDRHSLALILPGHDLYVAQVEGHGAFTIPLKEITPLAGPAGIKVVKCKADRYYIFVDGKPTGQMCPTERIETDLGPHVVEWYDAITEQRRKVDIVVKDTRLSVRVKIE